MSVLKISSSRFTNYQNKRVKINDDYPILTPFPIIEGVKKISGEDIESVFKPRRGKKEPAFFLGDVNRIINIYNKVIKKYNYDMDLIYMRFTSEYVNNRFLQKLFEVQGIRNNSAHKTISALVYLELPSTFYGFSYDIPYQTRMTKHRAFYNKIWSIVYDLLYYKKIELITEKNEYDKDKYEIRYIKTKKTIYCETISLKLLEKYTNLCDDVISIIDEYL